MIELDGRRVETAWHGPAPEAAPTLVLLHEGLGSVGLWRDVPARLAEATGCGVFVYSRFGYGRSDLVTLPRPLTYMHEEAALLPRVLSAAGVRRCILVGHSDGASIAAIHAGGAQDFRVRGLVLIAPHFFVEDVSVESIAAIRAEYEAGACGSAWRGITTTRTWRSRAGTARGSTPRSARPSTWSSTLRTSACRSC